MPDKKKYPPKRRMKFTPDPKNPDKKSPSMRDQSNPSDAITPKHGIYKRKPVAHAAEIKESKPKKKSKKPLFGNRKYKIQYSSHEKAKKAMHKNVKRKQKGKGLKNFFDL